MAQGCVHQDSRPLLVGTRGHGGHLKLLVVQTVHHNVLRMQYTSIRTLKMESGIRWLIARDLGWRRYAAAGKSRMQYVQKVLKTRI